MTILPVGVELVRADRQI